MSAYVAPFLDLTLKGNKEYVHHRPMCEHGFFLDTENHRHITEYTFELVYSQRKKLKLTSQEWYNAEGIAWQCKKDLGALEVEFESYLTAKNLRLHQNSQSHDSYFVHEGQTYLFWADPSEGFVWPKRKVNVVTVLTHLLELPQEQASRLAAFAQRFKALGEESKNKNEILDLYEIFPPQIWKCNEGHLS